MARQQDAGIGAGGGFLRILRIIDLIKIMRSRRTRRRARPEYGAEPSPFLMRKAASGEFLACLLGLPTAHQR